MLNSSGPTPQRDQFTLALHCPKCGAQGSSVWEENRTAGPSGPQPSLISLSAGFYERLGSKSPYPIELVCHRCETIQPQ